MSKMDFMSLKYRLYEAIIIMIYYIEAINNFYEIFYERIQGYLLSNCITF